MRCFFIQTFFPEMVYFFRHWDGKLSNKYMKYLRLFSLLRTTHAEIIFDLSILASRKTWKSHFVRMLIPVLYESHVENNFLPIKLVKQYVFQT